MFKNRKTKTSPAREALAATVAELATARDAVDRARSRIERLDAIVAAVGPADEALKRAASADSFETGVSASLASLADAAEVARKAAVVASVALPEADAVLADLEALVAELETKRRAAVHAVLIEQADKLGAKYRDAVNTVATLHDELVGLSRGLARAGYPAVAMVDTPLEFPRFSLPALPQGDVHSTYLKHDPAPRAIAATSFAWSRFAAALAADPSAEFEPATEIDPDEPNATALSIKRRERSAEPSILQVLFGAR